MLRAWTAAGWRPFSLVGMPGRGIGRRRRRRGRVGVPRRGDVDLGGATSAIRSSSSGSADVFVHGDKVREVGPGDVIGEIAVLASGRRTASVVATSPVQVIALFKRDVWRFEDDAPEAAGRLRAAMEGHVGSESD